MRDIPTSTAFRLCTLHVHGATGRRTSFDACVSEMNRRSRITPVREAAPQSHRRRSAAVMWSAPPPLVVKMMAVLVAVSLSRAVHGASVIPGGFTVYNATDLSALVGGRVGVPPLHPRTRDMLV